jgi:hypothetical protein
MHVSAITLECRKSALSASLHSFFPTPAVPLRLSIHFDIFTSTNSYYLFFNISLFLSSFFPAILYLEKEKEISFCVSFLFFSFRNFSSFSDLLLLFRLLFLGVEWSSFGFGFPVFWSVADGMSSDWPPGLAESEPGRSQAPKIVGDCVEGSLLQCHIIWSIHWSLRRSSILSRRSTQNMLKRMGTWEERLG